MALTSSWASISERPRLKAGLFDADGRLRASGDEPLRDRARAPGVGRAAAAGLAGGARRGARIAGPCGGRPEPVRAIGICSQVNTHVFVDAAGEALRPAITWQDQRCGEIALELAGRLAEAAPAASSRFGISSSTVARARRLDRT